MAALVLELAQGLGTQWFAWHPSELNPAFAEGREWWSGRLSIPVRILDTAYDPQSGKVYNAYPPLLSFISFVAHAPLPGRSIPTSFPEFLPLILFGLPLPMIGYWAFSRLTTSPWWAATLTLGWLGGTALMGVTRLARNCDIYHLNHILSQYGLLLLTVELVTRRRLWIMLIGLAISAWSRQLTLYYAPAIVVALRLGAGTHAPNKALQHDELRGAGGGRRAQAMIKAALTKRRTILKFGFGLFVIMGVPMALNWAKFGRPWRSGYELMYDLDSNVQDRVQRFGLFSTAFLARNSHYMFVDIPNWQWAGWRPRPLPSVEGTSIWFTSPVLALVWLGLPAWWRDPMRRTLMLCSLAIIAGHLLYHATGETAPGYYRYSLDYIPVWMAIGAGWLTSGWRRWITLACIAWSVTYFSLLYS